MGLKNQILIDIEKCYECAECEVSCSAGLHHRKNGFKMILEEAIRKVTCRHCEDAPCIESCPVGALKKEGDNLKRAGLLCTSCGTCVIACPFGVNTVETVEFLTAPCDICEGRKPLCVKTCPKGAVLEGSFKEDDEKNIYKVREGIFVRGVHWKKQLGLQK